MAIHSIKAMRCPHHHHTHTQTAKYRTLSENRSTRKELSERRYEPRENQLDLKMPIKRIRNNNKWHLFLFFFCLFSFCFDKLLLFAVAFRVTRTVNSLIPHTNVIRFWFIFLCFPFVISFRFFLTAVWYQFQFVEQREKQFQLSICVWLLVLLEQSRAKKCAMKRNITTTKQWA